jgi:hypothetical protein
MNAKVSTQLAIIVFLHSMNGNFEATIAALKTMSDYSLTWDVFTARMIEEASTNFKPSNNTQLTALVTSSRQFTTCSTCSKPGHKSDVWCWNSENPNNKLRENHLSERTQRIKLQKIAAAQKSRTKLKGLGERRDPTRKKP